MDFQFIKIAASVVVVLLVLFFLFGKSKSPSAPSLPQPAGPANLVFKNYRSSRAALPFARTSPLAPEDFTKGVCSVLLTGVGGNKILAIKAVRGCRSDLSLLEAKNLVEASLPHPLFAGLSLEDGPKVKDYLAAAGVTTQVTP